MLYDEITFWLVLLFALAVGGVVAALVGRWVLRPLTARVNQSKRRIQFMLTDFIWLLVQLQVGIGLVVMYVPQELFTYYVILMAYSAFAVTGMWAASVFALSRIGIRDTFRRGVFILFFVPATVLFIMSCAVPFVGICLVPFGFGRGVSFSEFFMHFDLILFGIISFVVAPVSAVVLFFTCRGVLGWVLVGANDEEKVEPALAGATDSKPVLGGDALGSGAPVTGAGDAGGGKSLIP